MNEALVALWLLASHGDGRPARFHERVVVTAERGALAQGDVVSAVTVLDREDIESMPAENLAELLDGTPFLEVLFAPAFGQAPMVIARGFFGGGEAEYVRLLVDGIPLVDAESGLADWWRVRTAGLERVEALRGPGSSLYGDTALGGVVQVFTRTEPGGAVALSGGSFGSAGADLSRRWTLGGRRLGLSASASRTDGFRTHAGTDQITGQLAWSPAGAAGWSVRLSGSAREREEPGALRMEQWRLDPFGGDPLFRLDRERLRRLQAAVGWAGGPASLPLRASLHGTLRDTRYLRTLLLAAGLGDKAWRETDTTGLGASLEGERRLWILGREGLLRAGVEGGADRADTSYFGVEEETGARLQPLSSAGAGRSWLAVYAVQDWRPRARVRLVAGLRGDWIRDRMEGRPAETHGALSPRAGASVRLGPASAPTSVFAQVSRAFKAPTLDQLFDPRPFPDFQGGSFTISNPLLQPQKAFTWEAGLTHSGRRLQADLAFYRMEVEDEIDFDAATFRYSNIGRSLHEGWEAALRLLPRGRVSPQVAYAWTRAEPTAGEYAGRQLKNIPRHAWKLGLRADLPAAVRLEARLNLARGRYLDDDNSVPSGDLAHLDLRLQRRFGRIGARLDLLNLTDRRQVEVGYVLPDFVGRPVPHVLPGHGRAVRAGVEWVF